MIHLVKSQLGLLRERMLPVKRRWTGQSVVPKHLGPDTDASPGGKLMIIEMRTYKTKPGMRSRFLEIFRTKSIPAHADIGMKILGPFLSVEDADTFFFMRGFPDLASREPMKAKFYEGELWKRELENLLMPMLDKYDVVLVEDPEGLVRWR
jgi:hypothetical protein